MASKNPVPSSLIATKIGHHFSLLFRLVLVMWFLGLSSVLPASGQASAQGSWTGPYDWSCQLQVSPQCVALAELSHAALIPTGPYQGQVLMWREPDDTTCYPTYTGEAWIFDPANPDSLIRVAQALQSNIFCGGASWDPQGELVIAGGDRNTTGHYGKKTYRFRPLTLGAKSVDPQYLNPVTGAPMCSPTAQYIPACTICRLPFLTLGSTLNPHYYPTVLALSKRTILFNTSCSPSQPGACDNIVGGAHLILGGPILDGPGGQDVMTLLPYRDTIWRSISFPGTIGPCPSPNPLIPCSEAANAEDRFVLRSVAPDPLPSPRLDSYPRALQLSNGDILIAFDLDTADPCSGWPGPGPCTLTQPNDAAAWWVFKPYESGPDRFQLWRGNSQTGTPALDRNYAGAVMRHQAADIPPRLDRVLVFGGADSSGSSASVQEFELGSGPIGGTVVNGTWHGKQALAIPRHFINTLELPTGQVLLTQGTNGTEVVQPELYDPGRQPSDPGSRTLMAFPNQVGSPPKYTSRTYHHLAVLLPDGRVFIAGGQAPTAGSAFANGQFSGEIFSPPYLHTGLPRPIIQDADTKITMNTEGSNHNKFSVTVHGVDPAIPIERVVLTRPAAVTHGFDSDQRYIELPYSIVASSGDKRTLSVVAPAENLGPPGLYMLWVIVNTGGSTPVRIPTTAEFVWCS